MTRMKKLPPEVEFLKVLPKKSLHFTIHSTRKVGGDTVPRSKKRRPHAEAQIKAKAYSPKHHDHSGQMTLTEAEQRDNGQKNRRISAPPENCKKSGQRRRYPHRTNRASHLLHTLSIVAFRAIFGWSRLQH